MMRKRHFSSNIMDTFNTFVNVKTSLPIVQKCKKNGFIVGNVNLKGGVFLINSGVFCWDVERFEELKIENIKLLDILTPLPEIFILGNKFLIIRHWGTNVSFIQRD
jgi:uncharacterized protein